MRRSTRLPLLVCLLALAAPAGAQANAADDHIVQDCQTSATGALTGTYTQAQLRHAKRNLPGDVLEYSGCYDAIQQAIVASATGGGSNDGDGGGTGTGGDVAGGIGGSNGSGGGGSTGGGGGADAAAPGTPAAPPHRGTEVPVEIAGAPLEPGELPSIGQDANALPASLVVLLALLALLALAALVPAVLTIGRRVVARRRA